MKTRFWFPLVFLFASTIVSRVTAQESRALNPKFADAQTPILINAVKPDVPTLIQAFDVDATKVQSLTLSVSEPRLLKRLEARVGKEIVGGVVLSDSTESTQVEIKVEINVDAKSEDALTLWAVPSPVATPYDKIQIGVNSALLDGVEATCDAAPIEYRFGVILRDVGWDDCSCYRIPGLARSNDGTLIAVYDARWRGFPDLPADIDVACSRSFDGGKTWTPMQIAINFHAEDETLEGVGDPSILVDSQTGRIWIAALWAHNGKSYRASEPGLEPEKSGRLVLAWSDDDGATWSEPRDVTNEVEPDKDWRILFQGPGSGITTRDGKLVFPAQYVDSARVFHSTIVWSGDRGETWKVGTGARDATCEAAVVELNDGTLMLNMRNTDDKTLARSIVTTDDMGESWKEHETSCNALDEPVCQASLIRMKSTLDGDDANLLAFMNPASKKGRVDMTLKLSEDEGRTWTRALTLYRPGSCGYSSLAKIDDETLGVLYETNGGLIFQVVKIQDVPM